MKIMQMTPNVSCIQRYEGGRAVGALWARVVLLIIPPDAPFLLTRRCVVQATLLFVAGCLTLLFHPHLRKSTLGAFYSAAARFGAGSSAPAPRIAATSLSL